MLPDNDTINSHASLEGAVRRGSTFEPVRQFVLALLFCLLPALCLAAEEQKFSTEDIEFFEKKIRPVLVESCQECHQSGEDELAEGGLELDWRGGLAKGGDTGSSINLSDVEQSLLLKAITYTDSDLAMPPDGKISAQAIQDIRTWLQKGAAWPDEKKKQAVVAHFNWEQLRESHWAWKAVKKSALPETKDTQWASNEIDFFVLARLEAQGMQPSPRANKRTLIRRAYLDMLGIPPTRLQVQEFVSGKKNWNQVIEDLLSSPRHGERWGRHWLDVARYSDGYGGYNDNAGRDDAWRYRDGVVQSLNNKMPIDQFLRLQIAGDLIDDGNHSVATGFFALGPIFISDGGDPDSVAMAKIETLDDRVDTLSRGMLGVTLACARCHDHKFDPLPTMDYYSIAGVFNNSSIIDRPIVPQEIVDQYNVSQAKVNGLTAQIVQWEKEEQLTLIEPELRRISRYLISAREWAKVREQAEHRDAALFGESQGLSKIVFAMCAGYFSDEKDSRNNPVMNRWFTEKSDEAALEYEKLIVGLLDNKRAGEKRYQQEIAIAKTDAGRAKVVPVMVNPQWVDQVENRLNPLFNYGGTWHEKLNAEKMAHRNKMKADLDALQKAAPAKYPIVHSLNDSGAANMKIALRGNLRKPGEEAPRRFLRLISGENPPHFKNGSGRLELAHSITAPGNPLASRVFVNRVWGWHFGQAIVPSRSNFGSFGQRPTHPLLLDWLAASFVEQNWSLEWLHRKILQSSTWQMSSQFDEGNFSKDGSNAYLWRQNSRKLEVEAWRDSMLFVTQELNEQLGGIPTDNLSANSEQSKRRTIYAKTSRNGDRFPSDKFLSLFDFPIPSSSIAKRSPTITPQQSLFLLNHPFVIERAKVLAKVIESGATSTDDQIKMIYETLFSRLPADNELDVGRRFLGQAEDSASESKPKLSRFERYAHALLSSNEFIFVE